MNRTPPNHQKKYRKNQLAKGLVRFEIQVKAATKAAFDKIVENVAEEYAQPFDKRKRVAKARAQVFDDLTKDIRHNFFELQDRIESMRNEIKALTPKYFKTDNINKSPLPEAISALPDDSVKLKQILAKLYIECQQAIAEKIKYKRRVEHAKNVEAGKDEIIEIKEKDIAKLTEKLKVYEQNNK